MKFGNIYDSDLSPEEYRVKGVLDHIKNRDVGSFSISRNFINFLESNKDEIQDMFLGLNTLYILPATKKFASTLFMVSTKDGGVANEIDWQKIGRRYYLKLWWD